MGKFKGRGKGCGCGIGCGCGCCGGGQLARCSLTLFNIIFLVAGVTFVVIGIWLKLNKDFVSLQDLVDHGSGDSTLSSASSVIIGFGCFVACVTSLGFYAVCCAKNKCLLILYTFLLAVIFISGLAAAIVYGKFKGKVDDTLSGALKKTVKEYKEGSDYAKDWDYVQTWIECCGSSGPKDYINVTFKRGTMHVPETCCVLANDDPDRPEPKNGTACQIDALMFMGGNITSSHFLRTKGCYEGLGDIIAANLVTIIIVGVVIATLQLLGLCFAIGLCCDRENEFSRF